MPLTSVRQAKHEAEVVRWTSKHIARAMGSPKPAGDKLACAEALAAYAQLLMKRKAWQ